MKLTSLVQVCIGRSIRPRRGRNFSSPNQPQQIILCCSVAVMSDCETWWTAARQASPSFTVSQSLLKLMSVELMMSSNHLILCHPLLLLPSVFPSIRVFSNQSGLHIRWPRYCSFSFSPSNKYSGLISFRIDWFHMLAVQGILPSLFKHHSSKTTIF